MRFYSLRYFILFISVGLFGQVQFVECSTANVTSALYCNHSAFFGSEVIYLLPSKKKGDVQTFSLTTQKCAVVTTFQLSASANVLSFGSSDKEVNIVSEYYDVKSERLLLFLDSYNETWSRDTLVQISHSMRLDKDKHLSLTLEKVISKLQVDNVHSEGDLRFTMVASPNQKQRVLYTMESRGEQSKMRAWRFTSTWSLISEVDITIDRGYVLSTVDVDNEGNIYLLKYSSSGDVGVLKCTSTKEMIYQAIKGTSSQKDNLRLVHLDDDSFGVLKLSKNRDEELTGVVFTPMNFDNESVQSIHIELNTTTSEALANRKNFHLAKILKGENGEFFCFLEQHSISINGSDFVDFDKATRPSVLTYGQVRTGDVILFKLDHTGNQVFQKVFKKSQLANLEQGINEISFESWVRDDQLFMLYACSKGGMANTKLYLETINSSSGEFHEQSLISSSKFTYQRWSFLLNSEHFSFLAKKGLVGNKLYQGNYKY